MTTPALPPSGSNPLAALPSVAIAGRLVTVNPGIERMVTNIAGNPAIRVLVLCGADSPVFHAAQGGAERSWRTVSPRIGASSPRTDTSRSSAICPPSGSSAFVVGWSWWMRPASPTARRLLGRLRMRSYGPRRSRCSRPRARRADFQAHPSGGHREPIGYDPKAFFLVTLDRPAGESLCRHDLADNTPAHATRSRSG